MSETEGAGGVDIGGSADITIGAEEARPPTREPAAAIVGPSAQADTHATWAGEATTDRSPHTQPSQRAAASLRASGSGAHIDVTRISRGQLVGRYVILDRLGAGGMGVVFAAWDPELDRKLAIKLLRAGTGTSGASQARDRLLREAQAMAKVTHPNVIAVHDVGTHGGSVFVAMEFVAGRALGQVMRERQVSWRTLLAHFIDAGRGLAAAHAAGLVHRDFKPDNVMLGDDGRVRVLDFGLAGGTRLRQAYGADVAELAAASASASARARVDLTRTGAVMGTPAYMSPEQHLGLDVGSASDQFSFCVALFEALCGERPFSGATVAALSYEVVEGRIRTVPRFHALPAPLRRAILRGLSVDPTRRFPSMDALLEALGTHDRQRRALRGLGLAATIAGLVALSWWQIAHYQAARAVEAERRRQEAALTLVESAGTNIERSFAEGDERRGIEAFEALSRVDELRNTRAMARAWLDHAPRLRAIGRVEEARDAFARGYVVALDRRDRVEALVGLLEIFVDRWEWERVAATSRALGLAALADPIAAPTALRARIRRAVAARELSVATAWVEYAARAGLPGHELDPRVEPILSTLTFGSPLGVDAAAASLLDIDADGVKEVIVAAPRGDRLVAVSPSAPGQTRSSHMLAVPIGEVVRHVAGFSLDEGRVPTVLVSYRDRGGDNRIHVASWSGQDGVPAFESTGQELICSALADIEGNGAPVVYGGIAYGARGLIALSRHSDGAWSRRDAHRETTATNSDLTSIVALAPDAAGKQRLFASVAAWGAYDVRLFAGAPDGALALLKRERIGLVLGATRILIGDREWVIALESDGHVDLVNFPPDRPSGVPAGLYGFPIARDGSAEVGVDGVWGRRLALEPPWPSDDRRGRPKSVRMWGADVDGDGHDDLIVASVLRGVPHTTIYRQLVNHPASAPLPPREVTVDSPSPNDEGAGAPSAFKVGGVEFAAVHVESMRVLDVGELDGDEGAELLVVFPERDAKLWVIGMGDTPLPRLAPKTAAGEPLPVPDSASGDPVAAHTWHNAEELVAMGLLRPAADALEHAADLTGDPDLAAAITARAAALHGSDGASEHALMLYERAAARDSVAQRSLAAAARIAMDRHDFQRASELLARAHAAQLAAGGDAPAAQVERDLDRWIRDADQHEVRFDFARAPDERLRMVDPLAVRWDGQAGGLQVSAVLGDRDLLVVPIEVRGDRVIIEIELDLRWTEWESAIQVGLRRPGAAPDDRIALALRTEGGAGRYHRDMACLAPGQSRPEMKYHIVEGVGEPETVSAVIDHVSSTASTYCRIDSTRLDRWSDGAMETDVRLPPGPYEVFVAGPPRSDVDLPSLATIVLRRLVIRGATLAQAQPLSHTERGNLHWIRGDAERALAEWDRVDAPSAREWAMRALALAVLGQRDRAVDAAARLAGEVERDAEATRTLVRWIRVEPSASMSVLQSALGGRFAREYVTSSAIALQMHGLDERVRARLLADLSQWSPPVISGPRATADELAGIELTLRRADAYWHSGQVARAIADLQHSEANLGRVLPDEGAAGDEGLARKHRSLCSQLHATWARIEAAAGRDAEAFEHLQQAIQASNSRLLALDRAGNDPAFTRLQGDPRWALLATP